jgi:uncharacterized OB-fold protein
MAATSTLEIDKIEAAYLAGLSEGRLLLQVCACGHAWLPPREACPACLAARWTWQAASGSGRLKSWVVYHTAFHESFRDRLPYNVALVELDEGPRMITNVVADNARLTADARVRFVASREGDGTSNTVLARFELVS